MRKYWQIFKISWQNALVYRLNFVMWRIRTIIQFLVTYFLWRAVFNENQTVFGYDSRLMFTYILGVSILRSLVLSSQSQNIGVEIANGDLNNYLIKPLNYLKNWFFRDLADKCLNILFMVAELAVIILVLRPPLLPPAGWQQTSLFLLAAILAMWLYFLFSFLISSFTFWYPEHDGWPLRFVFFMIMEFAAGAIFPLDIFPGKVYAWLKFLPSSYFLFFPLQLYLGRLTLNEVISGCLIMLFWWWGLWQLVKIVWRRGLAVYGAYGR